MIGMTIADANEQALRRVADEVERLCFALLYESELRSYLRWPFGPPPYPGGERGR